MTMSTSGKFRQLSRHFMLALSIAGIVVLAGCSQTTDTESESTESTGLDSASTEAAAPEESADSTESTEEAAPAETVGGNLSVSGKVTFTGTRPEPAVLNTSADEKCTALHGGGDLLSQAEVVSENGEVRYVFVSIKNPPEGVEYPVPEEAAVLNQQGCRYVPHMMGLRAGQTLDITNSDELLHNVRSFSRINRSFNIAQPKIGVRQKIFKMAESAIKIKCDIHPWMTTWLFSMNHPFYATTDASGNFTIEGLPAGKYTLEAWHEKYGTLELEVDASTGSVDGANFAFAPTEGN